MSIFTLRPRTVKPSRVSRKAPAPFAEGLEPASSPLPSIDGSGLSKSEVFRIWGAANAAKADHAADYPDADLCELAHVGRAAERVELKRLLKDRPPVAVSSPTVKGHAAAFELPTERRRTQADELFWSICGGVAPIAGGSPEDRDWDAMYRDHEALYGPAESDDVVRRSDYLSHTES